MRTNDTHKPTEQENKAIEDAFADTDPPPAEVCAMPMPSPLAYEPDGLSRPGTGHTCSDFATGGDA